MAFRPLVAAALAALVAAPAVARPLGDVSGDARLSVADLVAERLALDADEAPPAADANRDGVADDDDLAFLRGELLALPPTYAFPVNPDDGTLLLATTPEGRAVAFFGAKAADGSPTSVDSLLVEGRDGEPVVVELDGEGRPAAMVLPDGLRVDVQWVDGGARLLLTLPDGTRALASATWAEPGDPPPGMTAAPGDAPTLPATLGVTQCGRPSSRALTSLTVTPEGQAPYLLPGRLVAPGTYGFAVPVQPSAIAGAAEEACLQVADLLGTTCDVLQALGPQAELAICPLIGIAVSATATPAAGVAATAGCYQAFGAARLACNTAGFSPTPTAPPALAAACPLIGQTVAAVERHAAGDVQLVAHARLPGRAARHSSPQVAPASGPFPAMALAFDGCREDDCTDGVDDDDDGDLDCDDDDCRLDLACTESSCGNGLDDDGDGLADCDDEDCRASTQCAESSCSNALDDDADGDADCADHDCLSDPECSGEPLRAWVLGATCSAEVYVQTSETGTFFTETAFVSAQGNATGPVGSGIQFGTVSFSDTRQAFPLEGTQTCDAWFNPGSFCARVDGEARSSSWSATQRLVNGFGNIPFDGTSVTVAIFNAGVGPLGTITVPCE